MIRAQTSEKKRTKCVLNLFKLLLYTLYTKSFSGHREVSGFAIFFILESKNVGLFCRHACCNVQRLFHNRETLEHL